MTNKEKFKEVFGFYPNSCNCAISPQYHLKCNECRFYHEGVNQSNCSVFIWWQSEYKKVKYLELLKALISPNEWL